MQEREVKKSFKDTNTKSLNIKLPDWTLKEKIGEGSIGKVFVAENNEGKHFAAKIMRPTPFLDESFIERIVENSLNLNVLSRNLALKTAYVYAAGRSGEYYYIIMDYFQKGSLENIIRDQLWSFSDRLNFICQLAQAMSKIHDSGLIHGDLKPENIMLGNDFEPFINDFYQMSLDTFSRTGKLGMYGTPAYMAPEQVEGKFISKSCDIYSLGVIAFEILTYGKSPYQTEKNEGLWNTIRKIQENLIVPPSAYNTKIFSKLDSAIMKALHKSPEKRYQSMDAFYKELEIAKNNIPVNFFQKISGFLKQ